MDNELALGIAAVVGSMATAAIGFFAGARERRAVTLDKGSSAASNIADAYDKLNTALEERIETLEKQRKEAIKENKLHWENSVNSIARLNRIIDELKKEIAGLKIENENLAELNEKLKERIKHLERGLNEPL